MRNVLKLVAKIYSVASIALSFILIVGTIGSMDIGIISGRDALIKFIIAVLLICSSFLLICIINKEAVNGGD